MTDDNRKTPFSGADEEEDWDKALNAWEVPEGARPGAKPEGATPGKVPLPAPPKKAPLYRPATPTAATPLPPTREDKPASSFDPYDDDQDEATLVAQIPPELLEGAGGAPQRKGAQGSGLGQVFRRDAPRPPPATPPKKPDVRDALLDMLFEDPQASPTIAPPDEPSSDTPPDRFSYPHCTRPYAVVLGPTFQSTRSTWSLRGQSCTVWKV